jgi:hypothetical protein
MASPTAVRDVRHPALTATYVPVPTLAALGAAVATGLIVALVSRRHTRSGADVPARQRGSWVAYLNDHLSGSDAATAVVSKLARSHAGTRAGDVCAWLLPQLEAERDFVRSLVTRTGAGAAVSSKRLAGYAAGVGAQALAGGDPGELSLFRTFESLAIGVQGKRLLWRAARERLPLDAHDARARFHHLERTAIEQWERLDACRLSLVPPTFGASQRRAADRFQ